MISFSFRLQTTSISQGWLWDFYCPWQIPGNTGCIARTCAASAVGLHLVGVDTNHSIIYLLVLRHESCKVSPISTIIVYLCWSFDRIVLPFQPLGFQVDDTKLKRAGLDYWPYPQYLQYFLAKYYVIYAICSRKL